MTASAELRSGKGSRDENFPVASWLIKRRHRPAILAFYEFVRVADDIADHAVARAVRKNSRGSIALERSLLGESDDEPEGVALARGSQAARAVATRMRRICSTPSAST